MKSNFKYIIGLSLLILGIAACEDEDKNPLNVFELEDSAAPYVRIKLDETIDQAMVERGAQIFKTNCTACHKIDKRFIGPSPKGILKRRSPEWIMNMILDPELMVAEDRCAKDLLVEFNGAAMANQNMTEAQARDILEYFRTL